MILTSIGSSFSPPNRGFYNYDAENIGLIMSSLSFGIFFACVVSGKISDYLSERSKNRGMARLAVFSAGPVLTVISILLLFLMDKNNFYQFYGLMLLLSFAGAWGLGSFYCILPELMEKSSVEYATGFIGGIADLAMPIGPLIFGVAFGVKGLWTAAWLSCIAVCAISVAGCWYLMGSIKKNKSQSKG
jgi:MFS family permease